MPCCHIHAQMFSLPSRQGILLAGHPVWRIGGVPSRQTLTLNQRASVPTVVATLQNCPSARRQATLWNVLIWLWITSTRLIWTGISKSAVRRVNPFKNIRVSINPLLFVPTSEVVIILTAGSGLIRSRTRELYMLTNRRCSLGASQAAKVMV